MSDSMAVEKLTQDTVQAAKKRYRIPSATYRLQMHAGFTLRDALAIVPYLHRLGISDLYVSSLLKAQPGSLHGYDVVNHGQLNPELGTESDLVALADELHRRGMGMILDVVPNHMRVGEHNEWWMDVLENGPISPFAPYFDIAWQNHPRERLHGKVLLPILDESYGKVIKAGRVKPFFINGEFGISIDQTRLPLDPRTYPTFLEPALQSLEADSDPEAPAVLELHSVLNAARHLPSREDREPAHAAEARGETTVIKRRLRDLVQQHADVSRHINQAVSDISDSTDFKRLVDLLDVQPYRPSFWRVALDEINYRRFFDVNDLAALSTERIDVFKAIHAKAFEWLRRGIVNGLRIDHIDGLLDPKEYLDRLQQFYLCDGAHEIWNPENQHGSDESWNDVEASVLSQLKSANLPSKPVLYVVVEKILGHHETLPSSWLCDGTTGYEFLNEVNALFVDSQAASKLTTVYQSFTGQSDSFDQIAYEKKLQILRSTMGSELNVLAHQLDRLAQMEWWSRDFTLNGLRHALEEMIACFPVYRTYVSHDVSSIDRNSILRAARRARKMTPLLGREIFEFVCDTLSLRCPQGIAVSEEYCELQRQFVGKFQQLTSPVMAKGVEDTALYTFNRLVSLNEVGGDPSRWDGSIDRLHSFLKERSISHRHGLSALSTHDTKRGEDVRARINVLSEIPEEWQRKVNLWHQLNRHLKSELDEGVFAPDENEEYLLYQILLGAWPDEWPSADVAAKFVERVQQYMTKATREAKVHSSWISPDTKYDDAVSAFIAAILSEQQSAGFLADFCEFQQVVRRTGLFNSLSQSLIRCTAPGVPDIYQGCESWEDSLVDPDNRRPVDYAAHLDMLDRLEESLNAKASDDLLDEIVNVSNIKLFVIARSLRFRRDHIELFQNGQYHPVIAEGPDAKHLFCFMIEDGAQAVLIAVPRLIASLQGQRSSPAHELQLAIDASLVIPGEFGQRTWVNLFTGHRIAPENGRCAASQAFCQLPVCVLFSSD